MTALAVQQVKGSLGANKQDFIISTSDFSNWATKEEINGDAAPSALINREQFARLLVQNEIGVRIDHRELLTIEEQLIAAHYPNLPGLERNFNPAE